MKNRKLGGVLIGTYGVGKSMILELLARNDETMAGTRFIQFDAPAGGAAGLARQLLGALKLDARFTDVDGVLETIRDLTSSKAGFQHTTLAIDEAQMIHETDSIDFLHRLTNFRISKGAGQPDFPAFTMILAGHTELEQLVASKAAFRQRLTTVWHLDPLNERQTLEYVEYRMRAAGGDIWVFEEDAISDASAASGGIPRVINNICDVALMLGFALNSTRITRKIMQQAIQESCPPPSVKSEPAARDAGTV